MGMAYETGTNPFTLIAGEALASDRFIKLSGSTAVYADAGDEPVGVTRTAAASGEEVAVAPLLGGIGRIECSKAVSAGSGIYVANDGKASDAAVGKQIGIAITAASGSGGKIAAILWGPRGGNDVFSFNRSIVQYFDDFFEYDPSATTGNWAVVEDAGADTGDVLLDAAGGVLNVGCDGDDNDECYVSSIAEIFKFQTNKKLYFECRITLTEANTDDANWIIGLSDTVGANSLLDNGGGPMALYDGAVFFKVDGTMTIQFETSNAGTQTTNNNLATFTSGTTYVLGFFYDPNDGTTALVTPYVNGVAGTAHQLTISGLDEMHILMGVKAGGGNEENLKVDYVRCLMER
jgi:hypothetical protein